jgi:hypothetical protein
MIADNPSVGAWERNMFALACGAWSPVGTCCSTERTLEAFGFLASCIGAHFPTGKPSTLRTAGCRKEREHADVPDRFTLPDRSTVRD